MTHLPDFFIAGVPKAGTTSLYGYLGQHPEIFLSPIKEPTFFGSADLVNARWSEGSEEVIARREQEIRRLSEYPPGESIDFGLVRHWDDYLALFRNAGGARAVGEGSVSYFWLPRAAGEIRERIPAARIILILRDPAERLFSHYLASVWRDPGRSFRSRFTAGQESGDDWNPVVDIGHYHRHLRRFFEHFPGDQISIHLYEDYMRDPRRVLRDLFAFLGVRTEHSIDLSHRSREPAVPRFLRLHALRQRLLGQTRLLQRWVPEPVKRVIRRAYHQPRSALRLAPEDRRLVIDYYRTEINAAGTLIGRDLSAWLR